VIARLDRSVLHRQTKLSQIPPATDRNSAMSSNDPGHLTFFFVLGSHCAIGPQIVIVSHGRKRKSFKFLLFHKMSSLIMKGGLKPVTGALSKIEI
jgi:hypothetical protein